MFLQQVVSPSSISTAVIVSSLLEVAAAESPGLVLCAPSLCVNRWSVVWTVYVTKTKLEKIKKEL